MEILGVCNSKGGVGKSTVAVHLATGLARRGRRTLLVDMDAHGSSTAWLLGKAWKPPTGALGAYAALMGAKLDTEGCTPVPDRGPLWLLPSTPAMSHVSLDLAAEVGGETLLRESLRDLRGHMDVVVLDCPGDLNVVVLSAIVASDGVVVPVTSDYLALSGLAMVEDALKRARQRLRAKAQLLGYVHFSVQARHTIAQQTRELLQATGKLIPAEVRTSTAAKELPGVQLTAWDEGADPRGLEDYEALVDAIAGRMDGLRQRRAS